MPGAGDCAPREVLLIDAKAVLPHGDDGSRIFHSVQDCAGGPRTLASIKNPTYLKLFDPACDSRRGAAIEEDGPAGSQRTEELGRYDGTGPFRPQADDVDVGCGQTLFQARGGSEGDEADVGVGLLDGGAELLLAVPLDRESEVDRGAAQLPHEQDKLLVLVRTAECARVHKRELRGAKDGDAGGCGSRKRIGSSDRAREQGSGDERESRSSEADRAYTGRYRR